MTRWVPAVLLCAAVTLAPLVSSRAQAYSFLPGGFAPGEMIIAMQLAADPGSTPSMAFDHTSGLLTIDAAVSEITTTLATYSISTLGDVTYSTSMMLSTAFGIPGAFMDATFIGTVGPMAEFTIIDVAGSGPVYTADFTAPVSLNISAPLGEVQAAISDEFTTTGGDPNFVAALPIGGSLLGNLSNFGLPGGTPVTSICQLFTPACFPGASLGSFEVNPTITLTATLAVPEPALSALVSAVFAAALVRRRRGSS